MLAQFQQRENLSNEAASIEQNRLANAEAGFTAPPPVDSLAPVALNIEQPASVQQSDAIGGQLNSEQAAPSFATAQPGAGAFGPATLALGASGTIVRTGLLDGLETTLELGASRLLAAGAAAFPAVGTFAAGVLFPSSLGADEGQGEGSTPIGSGTITPAEPLPPNPGFPALPLTGPTIYYTPNNGPEGPTIYFTPNSGPAVQTNYVTPIPDPADQPPLAVTSQSSSESEPPRTFTGKNDFEVETANAIEAALPGSVAGVGVPIGTTPGPTSDADIQLANGDIVEVGEGRGTGKVSQVIRNQGIIGGENELIVYGPNFKPSVTSQLQDAGFNIFKNIDDLISYVGSKGK